MNDMKKTIAILLVLVIGMVGVFAVAADLTLTTTVPMNDEIKLTAYDTDYDTNPFDFGTVGSTSQVDFVFDLGNAWDNTSADTPQNVAYIHARSNRSAGFKVTATATALTMTEGSGASAVNYYIGYKITAGDAAGVVVPATSATTNVGTVMTVAAPSGVGYSQSQKPITVIPTGKSIDYKQGGYEATVTFTVAAQ
jgi:hypothetical protein